MKKKKIDEILGIRGKVITSKYETSWIAVRKIRSVCKYKKIKAAV